MKPRLILVSIVVALACFSNVHGDKNNEATLWLEGEEPAEHSFQLHGWYNSVDGELLSGAAWLGHFGDRRATARYEFNVERNGRYAFWLRSNPISTVLRYRIDRGDWTTVDSASTFEPVNVAADKQPDLRIVAWHDCGSLEFTAGPHEIEFEFLSENHFHGSIDCFCFTTDAEFRPSLTLKPGEEKPFWPAPEISEENFDQWMSFVEPCDEEAVVLVGET